MYVCLTWEHIISHGILSFISGLNFLKDFANDLQVDFYGTVQPHTLIRQHLDYSHWYDRNKLTLKDIHKCQYVACMNPTAGSFTINPRLLRHFCVFAVR
jgi:dynein heavy chain